MKIPNVIIGKYQDVQAVCKKTITTVKKGLPFHTGFENLNEAGHKESVKLILLHGPNPIFGSHDHIHLYLPLKILFEAIASGKLSEKYEESIFNECCQRSWSTLMLNAPANLMWLHPKERHKIFLEASLAYWEEWEACGACYTMGMNYGEALWNLPITLKHLLARHNVPRERINEFHSTEEILLIIEEVLKTIG